MLTLLQFKLPARFASFLNGLSVLISAVFAANAAIGFLSTLSSKFMLTGNLLNVGERSIRQLTEHLRLRVCWGFSGTDTPGPPAS